MARTTADVLCEVAAERERQDAKWGEQNHPDGTGAVRVTPDGLQADALAGGIRRERAEEAKEACNRAASEGRITYRHILDEEVREAFAEDEPEALRRELLQVAAVAVAWVEKIDRARRAGGRTRRAPRP